MLFQLTKRLFNIEEYHKMAEIGIFGEGERLELIEGEIFKMSPVGKRHAAHVKRLNKIFNQCLGERVLISVQDPVELNDKSEPLPDIALLQPREDFYESGHPQPKDILLLVEVADTTIEYDRKIKIPLYARSNIIEVWLVNIDEQAVEVYRQPAANEYQIIQKFQRGQNLSPQAFPESQIIVDQILGIIEGDTTAKPSYDIV